ncbi:MAG: hypothetical protein ITG02_13310 [Patulibacter sp.]|nr:hypothetical protein [Patulibacter sp.]
MSDEQPDRGRRSLEETLRAIADEVTKGAERFASGNLGDLENLAKASGIDAEPIKQFAEEAGDWLRDQIAAATQSGSDVEPMPAADPTDPRDAAVPPAAATPPANVPTPPTPAADDVVAPPRAHGLPHPLDRPTEQQARALAALQSGRWTVEPGTVVLVTSLNRGPGPEDAHALGMELHVRDWVDVDGDLTFTGELALARWAEAAADAEDGAE